MTSLLEILADFGEVYQINKGAKIVGAVGARAPTLFLPAPNLSLFGARK